MRLVLLAHHLPVGSTGCIVPDYEAALHDAGIDPAGVELCPFLVNGLSSVYHALAGRLRKNGRVLPYLLPFAKAKLGLDEYESVTLVTWSAPYALAEELLAIPADRDALDGWIALDSGYGAAPAGVVDWARLARDGRKVYSACYTDVATSGYADSHQFLEQVQREAGAPQGLFFVEHLPHDEAAHRGALVGLTGAARGAADAHFWEREHIGALHVGPRLLAAAMVAQGLGGGAPSSRPAIPPPPPTVRTGTIPPPPPGPRTLKLGMHGDDVRDLQVQLTALGYALQVDKDFGPETKAKVIAFQLDHHVGADGEVEKSTRAAIDLALAGASRAPTEPPSDNRATDIDAPPSPTPLRMRCLARAIAELGVHETPGPATTPRVQEYIDGCERAGHLLGLHGDEPAWCAAFSGWCEHKEALPGDVVAPWRAAVAEAWADAVKAKKAHPPEWTPRPGDNAVFGRVVDGKLEDPRVGGPGHLARVEIVPSSTGAVGIVGGNQGGAAEHGGAVTRATRNRSEVLGWIEVG